MARGRLQLDGYAPAIPLAGLASRKVDFRPHFDTARAEEPQSRYYRGRLRREPTNPWDADAVAVDLIVPRVEAEGMVGVREVVMLGYIPKSDNHRMARQMDAAEHPTFAGIWLQFVLPPKRRPNDRAKMSGKPAIDPDYPGSLPEVYGIDVHVALSVWAETMGTGLLDVPSDG